MFNNLIESKPTKQGSVGQSLTSIILHGGLIALMVVVTANAGIQKDEKAEQEDIQFMEAPKNEPPPPEPEAPPPPDVVAAPAPFTFARGLLVRDPDAHGVRVVAR